MSIFLKDIKSGYVWNGIAYSQDDINVLYRNLVNKLYGDFGPDYIPTIVSNLNR